MPKSGVTVGYECYNGLMPIDRLVVITGAGASRNLGGSDKPLPLMGDWAAAVRRALDKRDLELSDLVGIRPSQSGPEFETAVGEFLAWQRVLDLSARFLPFGLNARTQDDVSNWRDRAAHRARAVVEVLNHTLYEEFSGGRVSDWAAAQAYGQLLATLPFSPGAVITFATTNYDPAVELAMAELGRRPDVGDVAGPGRTRVLATEGLIARCEASRGVAVLHLHGKVGWYTQDDGSVVVEQDNVPYNEHRGTPTVLMPDPAKDPLAEPAIRDLWGEFDLALQQATHVLVLGHSLHDPVLVRHVRSVGKRLAVCVLPNLPGEELTRIQETLPGEIVELVFGPEPTDIRNLYQWVPS
jgi:hypothetical protein